MITRLAAHILNHRHQWPQVTTHNMMITRLAAHALKCCHQLAQYWHIPWWSPDLLHIDGILLKGPYLPCVSMSLRMAGRALLAGYHRLIADRWHYETRTVCTWHKGPKSIGSVLTNNLTTRPAAHFLNRCHQLASCWQMTWIQTMVKSGPDCENSHKDMLYKGTILSILMSSVMECMRPNSPKRLMISAVMEWHLFMVTRYLCLLSDKYSDMGHLVVVLTI